VVDAEGPASDWRYQLGLTPRDYNRAVTWLNRTGGMPGMSYDAWLLLIVRLRARIRTAFTVMLPGFVILIVGAVIIEQVGGTGRHLAVATWAIAGSGAMFWGISVLEARAGLNCGRRLGMRATRERAIGLREILGTARWSAYIVVFVAQSIFVVAAWTHYPARIGVDVTTVLGVEWLAIGWLVSYAFRRPAVAIDAWSLAVDERLRSQEAAMGLALTYLGAGALLVVLDHSEPVGDSLVSWGFGLVFLGLVAQLIGNIPRKWPNPYRRSWWAA
jgi:hypothetical protein